MKIENKIIVLGPSLNGVGGVANYYRNLNLQEKETISYFEINSSNKENSINKLYRLLFNYFKFIKLVSNKSVKIVHVNPSLDYKSFWRDSLYILISLIFSKKIIVFFRGWEDEYQSKLESNLILKHIFNKTYSKAHTFIVLGEIFRDKLIKLGVDSNKPFFIETTLADSSFLVYLDLQKKYLSFDNLIEILFISRIEIEKGIYIALKAFNQFCLQNPSVRAKLTVAGIGNELESAKKFAIENNINVDFIGHVNGHKKGLILNKCHIMLFPTYYGEGLPNSILEGMLYGMPIITRKIAGIPDIVINEKNGFITESLDFEVFTHFIEKIVLNKELYKNIAEDNHRIASNRFTTDKVRNRLLNIYSTFKK